MPSVACAKCVRKETVAAAAEEAKNGAAAIVPGTNELYFGCRYSTVDYIYKDELHDFTERGVLTALHLAFSRETREKEYVQHLLVKDENAAEVVKCLDAGGFVFICGATAMGTDVFEAFVRVLRDKKGLSESDARAYLKDLQTTGRYVQELWSVV